MPLQEQRAALHKLIDKVENVNILQAVYTILEKEVQRSLAEKKYEIIKLVINCQEEYRLQAVARLLEQHLKEDTTEE